MAVALASFAGVVLAEFPEAGRTGANPIPSLLPQYRESKDRSRYISDLTQIKNATLESEAEFFDRLEKQKKIEDIRLDTRSASGDLKGIRNRLSAAELVLLEQADEQLQRLNEPMDDAGQAIAAARFELQKYHDRATAASRAIAAGRLDAGSVVSSTRRMIKVAERAIQSISVRLPRGQDGLEAARSLIAKSLEDPAVDDAQRRLLADAQRAVEEVSTHLVKFNSYAADLTTLLQATRRDYLPECAVTPTTTPDDDGRIRLGETCHGVSLSILNRSAPALDELDQAIILHSNMMSSLDAVRTARNDAAKHLEMADATKRPDVEKIRALYAKAAVLLENAEDQLLETKRLLVEDLPGDKTDCAQCGDMMIRTRRVVDPACTCVKSNTSMLEAERLIRQARNLADEIGMALDDLKAPEESLRRVRGSEGVLFKLTRALERGEQFRRQEFDILPGDTPPRIPQEITTRNFPPMVVTYVARQSWHYPVYFEDMALERYGHHHGCLQPLVSYGKFLADLALLPYNVCLDSPCCIQYDLGLYRPGDDVPHLIYLPRPDCKAALFEAAVWTGLMLTP